MVPDQAARQLLDLSTTIRVEPSSTGDPRLRGALPKADIQFVQIAALVEVSIESFVVARANPDDGC